MSKTKYQKDLEKKQMNEFKSINGRPFDSFIRGVRVSKEKVKVSND